ncbi:hypothetical protein LTR97_009057 [Elasticomyces elasticus]|uniref:Heterokaryon incompatibility domain-containing protein n=1 Tax=Elasticomyces elasticus TaxID=574655 RepID=A0AAN7W318_9PEZI|nr:hypothetical protein LTR97_009057 [Elasticomyces elasticus]
MASRLPETMCLACSQPIYHELEQTRKEVRILVIEPAASHEPVRCTFQTISLLDDALPQYETVSYAWGDATKRDVVYIGGHQLSVPLSAKNVLQRMRRSDKPRTVWIDVICIDQQNLVDRNYLVQLMCEIYSSTSTGFIWLGKDDHNTEATFDAIRALYHEARTETQDFETFKETVWPGWWNVYGAPTSVVFDAKHMARLFDNAWFSRLWCVQEAALAPNSICHCGSQNLPLLHLLRAAIWLYSKTKSLPGPLDGHRGLARAVHIASYADATFKVPFQAGGNLLWMMNTLRQYSASLDKDHVYGLVGMYQRFSPQDYEMSTSLVPRYDRSARDIYCDATKLAMAELNTLDALLYVCHHSDEEVENNWLPTWVPQWQRKQDLNVDHFPLNHNGFRVSGDTKPNISPKSEEPLEVLTANGFVLDHVRDTSPAFTLETLRFVQSFLDLCESIEAAINQIEPRPTDLEHTLIASLDRMRVPTCAEQSVSGYRALKRYLLRRGQFPTPGLAEDDTDASDGHAYLEALNRWLRNRCFFTTTTGSIGIGPKVMRDHDLVVILYGSSVPVVLREKKARADTYLVVGSAYVNGVMYGEAMEKHRAGGTADSTFRMA